MTSSQKPKRKAKNLLGLFKAINAVAPIDMKIEKVIDSKHCIVSLVFPK